MSKIGRRYVFYYGLLTGVALAGILLLLIGRWLLPGSFGELPVWLPEDALGGFGFLYLHEWMLWAPSLGLAAIVLTFSFGLKPDDLPRSDASAVVRFSLVAIAATVVLAAVQLLAQPTVEAKLAELQFRQQQTRQLEDAYLAIKNRGADQQTATDLDARLNLLKRLGTLRPFQGQMGSRERLDYDFELQILKAHFDLDEFFKLRALPGVAQYEGESDSTVEELLLQAEAALASNKDQEFQANLWGFQVYRRVTNAFDQGRGLDRKALERAKVVVDESWARIYEKTLAADERLKASYFFRKGKSLGDYQFQNYLEAYYGFQELHRENPRDSEVEQHWELSRQKVAGHVLFQQDMDVLFAVPASENLVFLNREQPLEVVRIGKMLNTSQGVFLKDFEFLRTDEKGEVLLHWTAPYGRWTEAGIDFRVWDKENVMPYFPVVLTETPGDEFNPEGSVDPPLFQPHIGVRDLELVSAREPQPQTLGTLDLLLHGRAIEALGYNSQLFQTEFVVRLASPFAFFVVFLFTFVLAWHNRAQQQGRSWWFLIPLLPLVTEFLTQSAEWAARLTVGGLLHAVGLETTTVALVIAFIAASALGVILVHRDFAASRR